MDPDVLGGLVVRVGNMVLDASVRNRLEQLRKQVTKAAALRRLRSADQARRDHEHPQAAHRGAGGRRRRPVRGGHGAVRGRRHLAHARPRQLHVDGAARAAPRRDRAGAEPRVRQRRRRAVRRVGQDRGGRPGQAHRPPARGAGGRRAARPHRGPARQPARRQGRREHERDPAGRVQGAGRGAAPGREGAAAHRHQADRRHDERRPRPARARDRRPPDRQDLDLPRRDHQPEGHRT